MTVGAGVAIDLDAVSTSEAAARAVMMPGFDERARDGSISYVVEDVRCAQPLTRPCMIVTGCCCVIASARAPSLVVRSVLRSLTWSGSSPCEWLCTLAWPQPVTA